MKRLMMIFALALMVCAFANAGDYKATSLNLMGDTIWVINDSQFCVAAGTTIGRFWQDIAEIRAEWVVPIGEEDNTQMAGVGVGLSVPKLLAKIGVTGWPEKLNSSFGILGLVELGGGDSPKLKAGLYLTILKVAF